MGASLNRADFSLQINFLKLEEKVVVLSFEYLRTSLRLSMTFIFVQHTKRNLNLTFIK